MAVSLLVWTEYACETQKQVQKQAVFLLFHKRHLLSENEFAFSFSPYAIFLHWLGHGVLLFYSVKHKRRIFTQLFSFVLALACSKRTKQSS